MKTLKLLLSRDTVTENDTQGTLVVDGAPLTADNALRLQTLELPVIDGLPGSAIPKGIYPVVLAPSPKFLAAGETDLWIRKYANLIPHIIRIPTRTNILMHWGNDVRDTDGCVLVGMSRGVDWIGSSRHAFEMLWHTIEVPAQNEACEIEIIGSSI